MLYRKGVAPLAVRRGLVRVAKEMRGTVEVWRTLAGYSWMAGSSIETTNGAWTTLHTVNTTGAGKGRFALTWTFGSTPIYTSKHWRRVRLLVDGQVIRTWSDESQAQAWTGSGAVDALVPYQGQVTVQGWSEVSNSLLRTVTACSLTLTPIPM